MDGAGAGSDAGPEVPWWNAFSIMIFLCWFGAAGYLLTKYGSFVAGVVVVLAAICGLAGGAIIFVFLTKVLMPHERELTAFETDVVGVVGRVSSPIRAGGTGEIVYQQLGATRSAIARSEDGEAIAKEEEVYVIRYEKGIAYVRRWEDLESQGSREQGPEVGSRDYEPLSFRQVATGTETATSCARLKDRDAMSNSTVLIAEMGILVGIFLLGLLAKLFPKRQGSGNREQGSRVGNRADLQR